MKKIIFFTLALVPLVAFSQFSENFNDGLFKGSSGKERNVSWDGNETAFKVNNAYQLQLNASNVEPPVYLKTASSLSANAYWEFWVKLGFNPTSSNYSKVFLVSDEANLTEDLNGIYVRIGYTRKSVSLMRSEKGKADKVLIEGIEKRLDQSTSSLQVKVTLNKKGIFQLSSKMENEKEFTLEGSCKYADAIESKYFGIACYYTKTRAESFYFDDFIARELTDDEQESTGSDPGEEPDLGEEPEPDYDKASYGDILFSEIMAKPGADAPEWVELYNAGNETFLLKHLLYYYGDKSYKLPEGQINPGDYFVLTKTSAVSSFPEDIKVFGVTSFPVIADGGKLLQFSNADESPVSWFEYSDKMYGDNDKKAGGWSLECVDFSNKSNTMQNWTASNVAGGTPGRANSVKTTNPDLEIPEVEGIEIMENNRVKITFTKPMDQSSLLRTDSYSLDNQGFQIIDMEVDYPKGMFVELKLNTYPDPGTMILLSMHGVKDLSGYTLGDKDIILGEGLQASANDLVISEILFNPPTEGNEYVEIYNRSDKALDLRFLSITSRRPSDGSFNKPWPLSSLPLQIEPGEYLVITKSKDLVCSFFGCREETFFAEPGGMPSLANTSGCAVLLNNRTEEVIDEFAYNEKMHTSGISNKKGISLERINLNKPSDDPDNWHSASAECGYGTPGYENSQYTPTDIPDDLQEAVSVFYPSVESDSYTIYYKLDAPGYRCNAYIFDSMGRKINQIANNQLLGTEGRLLWNGNGDSRENLVSGIYVIYLEVYNTEGKVTKYRKPVVVK